MKILNTVKSWEDAIETHCVKVQGVRDVRSDMLTSDEVATINEHIVSYVGLYLVDPNVPGMLEAMVGLEDAGGNAPDMTLGDKPYIFTRNRYNRMPTKSRIGPSTKEGTYSNLMRRALWATMPSDPMTWDDSGQIVTARHRLEAMLLARHEGATLPLIFVALGVPTQCRDWTDKAKSRTVRDDNYVDTNHVMPPELVERVLAKYGFEEVPPANRAKTRKERCDMRSKVASMFDHRSRGKDIPTTGGKLSSVDEFTIVNRFDSGAFDELCLRVFESARSQTGKLDRDWTIHFAPSVVACGLLLASNDEEWLKSQLPNVEGRSPEDAVAIIDSAKQAILSGPLTINESDVEEVLQRLVESTDKSGPLAELFEGLGDKRKSQRVSDVSRKALYAPLSIASMSAFVQMVKMLREGLTPTIDAVWTTYRPVANKLPTNYRCFGGVDCGYIETRKAKD